MVNTGHSPLVDDKSLDSDEEWDWNKEAQSIVKEFQSVVNDIHISTKLEQKESRIYFNCEIKEGKKYCIELTAAGFRIVSNQYDTIDEEKKIEASDGNDANNGNVDTAAGDDVFYETMNALLDKISPLYRIAFSNQLIDKLNAHCAEGLSP